MYLVILYSTVTLCDISSLLYVYVMNVYGYTSIMDKKSWYFVVLILVF